MDKLKLCIDKGIQVMKITNILMLMMYAVIYVAVFNVFDTSIVLSFRDNADFIEGLELIMIAVGVAATFSLITYKALRSKNQWISYIVTIICTILQFIWLGMNGDTNAWVIKGEDSLDIMAKNAIYRTENLKKYASMAEDETNVFRCEVAIEIFKVIKQLALALMVITVVIMLVSVIGKLIASKREKITVVKEVKEKDTVLLKRLNIALAIIMVIMFLGMEVAFFAVDTDFGIRVSFEFLWNMGYGRRYRKIMTRGMVSICQSYVIPCFLFVIFVINNLIAYKKVILSTICYAILGYVVYCGMHMRFRYNGLWLYDVLIIYELLILAVTVVNVVFFIKRKRKNKEVI